MTRLESLSEKAEALHALVVVASLGTCEPFQAAKPDFWESIAKQGHNLLTEEQRVFKWKFLFTLAMTWCAAKTAEKTLSPDEFQAVSKILDRNLSNWSREAAPAYADLGKFVASRLSDERIAVGTWLARSLANKQRVPDEAEHAAVLGTLAHAWTPGYWDVAK